MSIAHIVTRGIGPDAAIKGIITAGILGGTADVTAPTFVSATVDVGGEIILLEASEALQLGDGGAAGAHGITIQPTNGGAAITVSFATADISASTVVLTTNRQISSTETLTITHTQAGNGIEDLAGNDMASFAATAVTNGSTVNTAPSDIYASASTISVNAADGAQLCVLSATDADPGETFTWAEVAGTGDTNNAAVVVASNGVVTVVSAATLGVGSYTYRAQATDSAANTRAEAFAFSVVAPPSSDEALVMTAVRSLVTNLVKVAAR